MLSHVVSSVAVVLLLSASVVLFDVADEMGFEEKVGIDAVWLLLPSVDVVDSVKPRVVAELSPSNVDVATVDDAIPLVTVDTVVVLLIFGEVELFNVVGELGFGDTVVAGVVGLLPPIVESDTVDSATPGGVVGLPPPNVEEISSDVSVFVDLMAVVLLSVNVS